MAWRPAWAKQEATRATLDATLPPGPAEATVAPVEPQSHLAVLLARCPRRTPWGTLAWSEPGSLELAAFGPPPAHQAQLRPAAAAAAQPAETLAQTAQVIASVLHTRKAKRPSKKGK